MNDFEMGDMVARLVQPSTVQLSINGWRCSMKTVYALAAAVALLSFTGIRAATVHWTPATVAVAAATCRPKPHFSRRSKKPGLSFA